MPNFFDAVGDSFEETVETVADHADDGADRVADTIDATVDEFSETIADAAPTGPVSISGDALIDESTTIFNVGPSDLLTEAPRYDLQGPEGSVRLGPAEIGLDIDHVVPGQRTVGGGVVVGGTRVTIDVDAPGVDGTLTGEEVFTVNPGVIVLTPRVGGPGFGGSVDVVIDPGELSPPHVDVSPLPPPELPAPTLGEIDVAFAPPAPPTPIPIPYPTIGTLEEPKRSLEAERDHAFERAAAAEPDTSRAEVEVVPAIEVPEVLMPDLTVPDVEVTVDEAPVIDFSEPAPSQFQDDLAAIDAVEAELDIFE